MRKSKQEMLEDVLYRLRTSGGITESNPGSVARMFSEVIIEELDPIYEEIDLASSMSFVSTSRGEYLDMLGELLGCERDKDESDDNYRARISSQVTVTQGSNLTAIRLKVLQIEGVADLQLKRFTKGTGSFSCFIIPQVFPIEDDILARVEREIEKHIAYGISFEVKVSEHVPVDLNIRLIFHSKTTEVERDHLRHNATTNVESYMSDMGMGSKIIINEIIERVMNTSAQIIDMEIKEIKINDKEYFVKNIEPTKEEQYYLRKINMV